MSSGQCHKYREYAIAPSVTNGQTAKIRLGKGSRSRVLGWAAMLAPAKIISMAAPTGTSAHGPGNSWTPLIRAPHDRIAASATVATIVRTHIGQRIYGTSAPTSAPSNNSQARAKLL